MTADARLEPERTAPKAGRPRHEVAFVLAGSLVALSFRIAGLSYALPDHLYHSDTPKQLDRVAGFLQGDLVPGDAYPTLHMYVVALLLKALVLLDPHALAGGPSWSQVVITARLLNGLLGAGMVPLVYATGKWLFDWRVGAVAAVLLALDPVHVLHAHYEMGDIPQAFFVVASCAVAARALLRGRSAAFLGAGALAGLAASAKYYGVLVFGALVVAALTPPRPWRRTLGLLGATAIATAGAFALTTPKFLVGPLAFLESTHDPSSGLLALPPPPLLERPIVAAKLLTGLAVDWLGIPLTIAAVLGALLMLRRGPRGRLALVTPVLVLAMYAAFRPNYLDDRNLVILIPFAALSAAVTVVGLADCRGWARFTGVAAALVLVALAAAGALDTAYLFQVDDTRQLAERWQGHHVPPGAGLVRGLAAYAAGGPVVAAGDLLVTNTQDDLRYLDWYSPVRSPRIQHSARQLARDGRLLARFELLPRAFTAPTITYYELGSGGVPYAFPPPDDIAPFVDALTFVDPAMLPSRLGVVVDHQPVTVTLVSRTPLPRLSLALTGVGEVRIRQGPWTIRRRADPLHPTLVELRPWRAFPWFRYLYPLTLEAREGYAYVRLLQSPCEAARILLDDRQWARAIGYLEACQGTPWVEPARLLDLAWARAEAGQPEGARRAIDQLEQTAPGLLGALADLSAQPDGRAWREQYRRLAGHGRGFWWNHTVRMRAAEAEARLGELVADPDAGERPVVRAQAGRTPAGYLKLWFPQQFLRGRYLVRARLRGRADGSGPLATLSVARHYQGRLHDVAASREWAPHGASASFDDVVLPVETELEPVKLEARVFYHGHGVLDIDEVLIVPDVRTMLAQEIGAIRRLLPTARRPGAPRQRAPGG